MFFTSPWVGLKIVRISEVALSSTLVSLAPISPASFVAVLIPLLNIALSIQLPFENFAPTAPRPPIAILVKSPSFTPSTKVGAAIAAEGILPSPAKGAAVVPSSPTNLPNSAVSFALSTADFPICPTSNPLPVAARYVCLAVSANPPVNPPTAPPKVWVAFPANQGMPVNLIAFSATSTTLGTTLKAPVIRLVGVSSFSGTVLVC